MIASVLNYSLSSARLSVLRGFLTLRLCVGLWSLVLTVTADAWGDTVSKTGSQVAEALASDTVGVPADVSTVQTGGVWSESDKEGNYRVIIINHGFDHIVSKLYLQWLEQKPEEVVPQVLTTAVFAAFNEMPVYNLDIAEWNPQKNRLRVELTAYNSYSGTKCRFIVEAMAPGAATLINRKTKGMGSC